MLLLQILFIILVFFLGLVSTLFIFPRKKIVAWTEISGSTHLLKQQKRLPSSISIVEPPLTKRGSATGTPPSLRGVFATFDKNNDGFITKQELRESLHNIGIFVSRDDAEDMVARVDCNGDGLIDFDEFHELFTSMMTTTAVEEEGGGDVAGGGEEDEGKDLEEAFRVFDGDGDGLISVQELGMVLSSLGFKEGKTLESCKEMIRRVDMDGDGMVNFDEFKKMMKV